MWHASAAGYGRAIAKEKLRTLCFDVLDGVGLVAYQFEEWTGYAYHVRRRLRPEEQRQIGDVQDLRGTDEGRRRFEAIKELLPEPGLKMAQEELCLHGK